MPACCLLWLRLYPLWAQNEDANQKKARATLDAMVAALGGQRWLTLTSSMEQGRTSGFYQGKPTGMTSEFYEIQKFPDQTRIELGKKRDVVEIYCGRSSLGGHLQREEGAAQRSGPGDYPPSRPFDPDCDARLAQGPQDSAHLWRPKPGRAASGRPNHCSSMQKMTA